VEYLSDLISFIGDNLDEDLFGYWGWISCDLISL